MKNLISFLGLAQDPYLPPDRRAKQPKPVPAPANAIVLFSGKQEDVAKNWRKNGGTQDAAWVVKNGAMLAKGGDIVTKQEFLDIQLHVEFYIPYLPMDKGQKRGNGGVGLQGRYEVQVLDSSGFTTPGTGDCGSIYNQAAPLVNACKAPEQWQAYDIVYRAPRFVDGKMTEKPRVTVMLNGILVQNNTEIQGPTGIRADRPIDKPGPVYLQDHVNTQPVQFRNIWVIPLAQEGSKSYDPK